MLNQETMQHKDAEIVDLHNQLESHPCWILQREEVQITEEKIGGGGWPYSGVLVLLPSVSII